MTATAPICPGSNQFVEPDHVHSGSRARCPTCSRWTPAHTVPGSRYFTVQAHCPRVHPDLGLHGPGCEAATTGECTCDGTRGSGLHIAARAAEDEEDDAWFYEDHEDVDDGHWTDRWDTPAELEGLR